MALWFSGKEKKKNGDKEEEGEQERSIRIVVVGDGNVGKSSLIYALMTEQFPDEASLPSRKGERGGVDMMPSVLPEMRIPGKFNPDGIDVVLVDTPPEDPLPSLKGTTVKGADALILVYNATDDESFRRLSTHWLPRLTRWHGGPIVLAGNQIDQRGADLTNASLEQQILPLMAEFPTVETCIECSARALINVAEVFYFAVKSVMHPSQPLYGGAEHTLTPPCLRALQRIFRHIDADNDGYLDDGELTRFQEATFGTTLSANELRGIRESITATGCSEGVDARRGLSESGFLHLNKLFIQRGRLETTWTILRRFGYDASCCSFAVKGGAGAMGGHGDERIPEREGLTLNEAVLDVLPEAIGLTANTVLELTPSGWTHLRLLFDRFSTPNQDGKGTTTPGIHA
jgi:Ras family protein T1